jgi:hypothetical protein
MQIGIFPNAFDGEHPTRSIESGHQQLSANVSYPASPMEH